MTTGKRKALSLLMCAAMLGCVMSFAGCGELDEGYDDTLYEEEYEDDYGDDVADSSGGDAVSKSLISKGDASDGSFTLMLYICASDLESEYGAATADIDEILYGDISDKLNIVIQTGGANEWQNSIISADTVQRYRADNNGLELVDDIGQANMTSPDTLKDFIGFCSEKYPAERYGLIMWDHGGGSVWGYGSDENYPGDSLTLDEFDAALSASQTTFSFIGFDACLMGSIETMITASRYADYLIGSENVEPGVGWYYTDWISKLSSNTEATIPEIGRTICSDFIKYASEADPSNHSTLAIYDLDKVRSEVIPAFNDFLSSCDTQIQSGAFNILSLNRGKAREVYSDTEHIDLINYANAVNNDNSDALCKALESSMLTYKESKSNNQYKGVSIYLPFGNIEYVDMMLGVNERVGFCDSYADFMKRYVNSLAGGHSNTQSGMNASFADSSSYDNTDSYGWYDSSYADEMSEYYSQYEVSSEELELTDMGDYYALSLSDDDWELITDAELCLYGYYNDALIEYGNDAVYSFDDAGNLIVDFDYTWVALNGMVVPFYTEYTESDENNFYTEGYVPAQINGEYYDIILVWDSNDCPEGMVAGARPSDENSLMASKGLYEIKNGDEITILCYAANEDSSDLELMIYSDAFTVDGGLTVSYESVDEEAEYEVYYMLTDIYNNYYWTESIYG